MQSDQHLQSDLENKWGSWENWKEGHGNWSAGLWRVGEGTGVGKRWSQPGEESTYVIPIVANGYLLLFFRVIF